MKGESRPKAAPQQVPPLRPSRCHCSSVLVASVRPAIGLTEARRIADGFEDLARRCGADLDTVADGLSDYFGSDSAREVFTCWLSLAEDARAALIARFRAGDR